MANSDCTTHSATHFVRTYSNNHISFTGNMSLAEAFSDITPDRYTYDPSTPPPEFGKPFRKYWAFDEKYVHVNHGKLLHLGLRIVRVYLRLIGRRSLALSSGSNGSLPLPVKAEVDQLLLLAERNPDKFHRVTYLPLLKKAR